MEYLLKNAAGNAFKRTKSKRKRDQLVVMGYVEVTEPEIEGAVPYTPEKNPAKKGQRRTGAQAADKTDEE